MVLPASKLRRLLIHHVAAFNRGVLTGDFSALFAMYHRDAVFELSDPVWVVHRGIDAIRRSYRGDPPRGTMRLGDAKVIGQRVIADYLWDAEPDRIAGQLTLEFSGGQVVRNVVTFAPD